MSGFLALLCIAGQIAPVVPQAVNARTTRAGIAAYYSPGVMARVARNRGMDLRDDVAGWAAVPNCSEVGRIVVASINGSRPERYQVLDCSHPRDKARHLRQGIVIEVDYQSAVRHGFTRRGYTKAVVWSGME